MRCDKSREIDLAAFAAEREDARFADFRAHYPTCPDCSQELGRWSKLERSLRGEAPLPGGPHPAEAELLAYAQQPDSMQQVQRSAVAQHLAGCASCRSEEAVLRGFDLQAVAAGGTEVARESAAERLRGAVAALADALFGWVPEPLWVPLALALLIVPAGLLIWGGGPEPGGSSAQLAAQAPEPLPAPTRVVGPVEGVEEEVVAPVLPEARPSQARPTAAPSVIAQAPPPPDALPGREVPAVAPPSRIAAEEIPAESSQPDAPPDLAPLQIAAVLSQTPIHYGVAEIQALGGPPVRASGALRGAGPSALKLEALGPDHAGWTSEDAPQLYWWLSEASDLPLEISLSDDASVEPLLELSLPGPHAAGIQGISLAERDVRLEPGVVYRWQLALVVDPDRRASDVRAGAALLLRVPDAEAARALAEAPAGERAHRYAALGYWYDAFALLSRALAAEPDVPELRAGRDALLRQVGLPAAGGPEGR